MSHKHCHCKHEEVKYCEHCNVCYCVKCGQEWGNNWYYNYPYSITYTTGTDFVCDSSGTSGIVTTVEAHNHC